MTDTTATHPEFPKLVENTNSQSQVQHKVIQKCPSCGGTDHSRRSSKKCLFYVPRATIVGEGDALDQEALTVPVAIVEEDQQQQNTTVNSISSIFNVNTNNNDDVNIDKNTTTIHCTSRDVDISTPEFIKLNATSNVTYKPVVDVSSRHFKIQETVYKVFKPDHRGRNIEAEASPDNLMMKYFTKEFIEQFVDSSNRYRQSRMDKEPNLYCWKEKRSSKPFSESDIYHFFAILYYFGLVVLPSKSDYWSTNDWMPRHPIVHEYGMTRARFEFLWRHFHPSFDETMENSEDLDNSTEEEEQSNDERVNVGLERVERYQHNEIGEIFEEDDNTNNEDTQQSKKVWYDKLTFVINHVRKVSQGLIYILGTVLSLDEMMIRFFGRSYETHRMKNKPIKEGYKFFVLTTKDGFIVNFTPDGRRAAKAGEQEYVEDKSLGKIESMILFMLQIIPQLKEKQLSRLRTKNKIATRSNTNEMFDEEMMGTFCLAMDNYFTLPKVIAALREMGIGIVGTARYRGKVWPPNELKSVNKESAKFNQFYWTVDEYGTLLARWMDNGMVFCCSTMHKAGNTIKRMRKRPRKTQNNRNHVDRIWGENGAVEIYIPTLIDDYNYWMGGVDVADQRISYYHPSQLVCKRTWIPIFMQLLSIIRNNAYLVHRQNSKKPLTQKKFLHHMVCWLMMKCRAATQQSSLSLTCPPSSTRNKSKKRRASPSSMSAVENLTERFPNRYATPKELHSRTNIRRGRCVFCSALWKDKKKNNQDRGDIRKETKRTLLHCQYCSLNSPTSDICFLCKEHFDVYHAF